MSANSKQNITRRIASKYARPCPDRNHHVFVVNRLPIRISSVITDLLINPNSAVELSLELY